MGFQIDNEDYFKEIAVLSGVMEAPELFDETRISLFRALVSHPIASYAGKDVYIKLQRKYLQTS